MNRRIFLSAILACGICASAFAIPARQDAILRTLPDGTTIEVYLHGDEAFHYTTLADGTLIKEGADGYFYYATATANGIEAMACKVGDEMPLTATAVRAAEAEQTLLSLRQSAIERRRAGMSAPAKVPDSEDSRLVILVEFSDIDMEFDNQVYTDMLNKEGYTDLAHTGSARDYFADSSYGQYTPTFDVFGPYKLSNKSTYYGRNDWYGNDENAPEMIVEACKMAVAEGHDLTKYDYDGDGYIDDVYVFYAGEGEATGGAANTVWPHRWVVSPGYNFSGDPDVGGVSVYDYACSNECYPSIESAIGNDFSGVGTFIHEFGHVLGLPDLYDTSGYYSVVTPDIYDVMDCANYLNYCRTPVSYSTYERMFMGWITPTQIDPTLEGDEMTLPILEEGTAYLLTESGDPHNMDGENPSPSTYYLMEVRSGEGWDYYANYTNNNGHGDCGLLITKIQYNASSWENNTVNNNPYSMGVGYVYNNSQYSTFSGFWPMFPGKRNQTKVTFGPFTVSDITRDSTTGAVSFTISNKNGDSKVSAVEDGAAAAKAIGGDGEIRIDGEFTTATVYTTAGQVAYNGADSRIAMPQGLYIVRVDGAATKVAVK